MATGVSRRQEGAIMALAERARTSVSSEQPGFSSKWRSAAQNRTAPSRSAGSPARDNPPRRTPVMRAR